MTWAHGGVAKFTLCPHGIRPVILPYPLLFIIAGVLIGLAHWPCGRARILPIRTGSFVLALLGLFGSETGAAHLQEDGMVHDPVNGRGRSHGVLEDPIPLAEYQIAAILYTVMISDSSKSWNFRVIRLSISSLYFTLKSPIHSSIASLKALKFS
jgi:hypothetical protein